MDKEQNSLQFQMPCGISFQAKGKWAICIGAALVLVLFLV